MKCSFCGHEFNQEEALKACHGCGISKCKMIKCPKCGYEMPPEPGLVKLLRRWFKHEAK